jgi:hypothetical protein
VKFDRKEVLRLDELVLSAVPRSEKLAAERRRMEGGQQVFLGPMFFLYARKFSYKNLRKKMLFNMLDRRGKVCAKNSQFSFCEHYLNYRVVYGRCAVWWYLFMFDSRGTWVLSAH